MNNAKVYAKAIVGGLVAGLSYAIPVVDDGLVPSEGLGVALAFILGLGVVYVVPNKTKTLPAHDDRQRA